MRSRYFTQSFPDAHAGVCDFCGILKDFSVSKNLNFYATFYEDVHTYIFFRIHSLPQIPGGTQGSVDINTVGIKGL